MAIKLASVFLIVTLLLFSFQNCSQGGFGVSTPPVGNFTMDSLNEGDPLIGYAWHLNNTGQKVFSQVNGIAGYDLGLQNTWSKQIFGEGIKIQISDDGVDQKHEDLAENFLVTKEYRDYLVKNWLSFTALPSELDL